MNYNSPGPLAAQTTRIAVLQMTAGLSPADNADHLTAAIDQAADGGARMMFTPEFSGMLDRDSRRIMTAARDAADDVVLTRVRAAAARRGLWVHVGSLVVRTADGALANRGFVIGPRGDVAASYDKIHLFDAPLANGVVARESDLYRAGERAVTVDTPVGRMGMMICYDLRFAGLGHALTDGGALILSIPAAFTARTGAAHWHVLLRTRAIENGAFVVAAAQTGRHEDGRETYGHSLVVDPWGEVLLDLGAEPGLGFADIDLDRVRVARSRIPSLDHRRAVPAVVHVG